MLTTPFRVCRAAAAAALLILPAASLGAQARTPAELRASVQRYVRAHDAAILDELRELLAIPNVATDTLDIRRNAAHLQEMLRSRGFTTELLEAPSGRHVPRFVSRP